MVEMQQRNRSGWTRGKNIGKGAFGSVNVAVRNASGEVFAVKSVCRETALPNQIESLENEIRVLRSISGCPEIVEYLGDDVSNESPTTSYRNLHLEYLPAGTVADVATLGSDDVDERVLRWRTRCVVSALKFVHAKGIAHCDVKGKNILVGPTSSSVKLADFGSAIEVKNKNAVPLFPRGSPLWMAPEVVRGEYQGPESDVWSLGCTVIEMFTGKPAWEDRGLDSLNRIGFSDELPEIPIQLSEIGHDFVGKCLNREPNQRWSCNQLLEHPFIASASPPHAAMDFSPRCVLDFADSDFEEIEPTEDSEASGRERIGKLATNCGAIWESDGWIAVRSNAAEETGENRGEGTSSVNSNLNEEASRTDSEIDKWQCCDNEEIIGLNESIHKLRCGGSRFRHGPQNMVQKSQNHEMWFWLSSLCNLLLLHHCSSFTFRYKLFGILNYFFDHFYLFLSTSYLATHLVPSPPRVVIVPLERA